MKKRFKEIFGCYPDEFKGINKPYVFNDQEAHELLKEFGFCFMCLGSGIAWAECCNGTRCECQGQAQSFTCQVCSGSGTVTVEGNTTSNYEFIERWAAANNGYLFPHNQFQSAREGGKDE